MPANKSKKGYITCRKKLIKQTKKNCTSIRSRFRVTNEKKNYNFWLEKFHNYENKTLLTKFKIVDVVKTISSSSFAKIPEKTKSYLHKSFV